MNGFNALFFSPRKEVTAQALARHNNGTASGAEFSH